jgi:hypothetical protein
MRNSFKISLLAAFKTAKRPMPNQTPNVSSCQEFIIHHKCKEDIPYFERPLNIYCGRLMS